MRKRFFLLTSREHPCLPLAEAKAILEAERTPYKILWSKPQLTLLEAPETIPESLGERSAFTRIIGEYFFSCKSTLNHIREKVKQVNLPVEKNWEATFSVRIKRIRSISSPLNTVSLESMIGRIIKAKFSRLKVDLENPEIEFIGVIAGGELIFGRKIYERPRRKFYDRQPRFRPIFHPATLRPNLARCMVNLARAREKDSLLDPFCGVGGILIEAGLLGCRIIGIDVKPDMIRGCRINLKKYGLEGGLIVSDAEKLPVRNFDCIATDPPYGISASTFKRSRRRIVESFLLESLSTLKKKGYLCIATPTGLGTESFGADIGFKPVEKHLIYVHRSLTRKIMVFQKG